MSSSSADDLRFACPACGKRYRWNPQFAGRSAKCGCGAKLVVPSEPPVEPAPQPDGIEAKCPSCSAPLAPGAVLCVNCGYNLKTGKKLSAVVVETDGEDDAGEDESGDDAAEEEERAEH
jgi:hypothetical protein